MNKKGNVMNLVIFVGILFVIMFVGFMMVVGSSVINWTADIVTPELTSLGMIESTNLTEIAGYTITPANNVVQNLKWVAGIVYVLLLLSSLGFAMAFRGTSEKWLLGFYVALMLILVLGAIFMSNIYEDFYDDSEDLGDRLKEHTILSFLILYSPMVMSIVGFIGGIILFSGRPEEEFV